MKSKLVIFPSQFFRSCLRVAKDIVYVPEVVAKDIVYVAEAKTANSLWMPKGPLGKL